jgi:hypothetical protein
MAPEGKLGGGLRERRDLETERSRDRVGREEELKSFFLWGMG